MKKHRLRLPLAFFTLLAWGCLETTLEPDPQFIKIHMHYGWANELDTFEQTFQKDLVIDGVATTDFWFTTEEQRKILARVESINFFSFPDTVRYRFSDDSIAIMIDPHPGWQFLRIEHLTDDKSIYWYGYNLLLCQEDYCDSLRELVQFIIQMIESKPEYQELPPANGGYI